MTSNEDLFEEKKMPDSESGRSIGNNGGVSQNNLMLQPKPSFRTKRTHPLPPPMDHSSSSLYMCMPCSSNQATTMTFQGDASNAQRIRLRFLAASPKHPMVLESLIHSRNDNDEVEENSNNLLGNITVISVSGDTAILEFTSYGNMPADLQHTLVDRLSEQGYPVTLEILTAENGNDAMAASNAAYKSIQVTAPTKTTSTTSIDDSHYVTSIFIVQGICCPTEVPAVRSILLTPIETATGAIAVKSCQIHIATKRVHVQHDVEQVSAEALAERLTAQGFPAQIVSKHKSTSRKSNCAVNESSCTSREQNTILPQHHQLQDIERSTYVESTLSINDSDCEVTIDEAIIQDALRSLSGVASCSYTSSCQVLKVQHDPAMVSCTRLLEALQTAMTGVLVEVLVNGGDAKLFLPVEVVDWSLQMQQQEDQAQQKHYFSWSTSHRLQLHVLLSGIFWVVSMVSMLLPSWWHWLQYFGLLSVAFGLPPIAAKAWRTVRRRQFDANCMMVTAALGALALGEFDEAASVSFLFCVSEYLESRATERARKALETIIKLKPEHANVIDPVTKEISIVPCEQIAVGSLISVRTGDKIAADGVVVEGTSSVDESSLTGESAPVYKTVGSSVSGGTINIGSTRLIMRTTSTVDDSAVSRLVRLVEEATANMSPTEKMIDSFARLYTPTVLTMAAIMATIPWMFGTETGRYWTLNALIIIVISCPCALTISTPVTYAAGLAASAQRGIIVKGGASLEALGSVTSICFDKTGTLSEGKFAVMHLNLIGNTLSRDEMLALLALMEAPSSHPLAAALIKAAKVEGISAPSNADVKEHCILEGEGVEATVNGNKVYVGNMRLFRRLGMYEKMPLGDRILAEKWMKEGATVGFLGDMDKGIVAAFAVTDKVRSEAKKIVDTLLREGYDIMLLTGDSEDAAQAVARQVGICPGGVHSQLLPEDKLHFVGSLKHPQSTGCSGICKRNPKVLFLGDGVNDAPAIAIADVGVSMGEGAAIAMEMSDVTLLDSNLEKLVYVLQMGKRVTHTIRENIILSLLCKLVVVALTFAGSMTLLFAIASDVGVMLLVTLNGLKLLPREQVGSLAKLRRKRYTQVDMLDPARDIV
ncbi:hypothetical protein MPSEU_000322800 [Mayamaea pseudoterrestris]|nr:hypothetical protein MPSEU_000322800 [Mayamaea pseudoterrestris]